MATRRTRRPPATTAEGRELEIASKAYDLAERQIDDGTASAQVITHFLKAKSTREGVELDLIQQRSELLKAQKDALAAAGRVEDLINDAIVAFKSYVGSPDGGGDTFD